VADADTAPAYASGDVPVLATPRVVALCEQAADEALTSHLEEGQTSVGFRVEITHLAPALVGSTVVASAGLDRLEGRRATFNVTVTDKCGLIAAGRVVRVIVDRASFMDKAR
jgi:fluoroacetyl-CoA thioesterase